jgi:lipopolysaccharide transport system permease protein
MSFRQRVELVENLILRDLRARYHQATLGIAWVVLAPLALSLIQAGVIVNFLRVQTGIAAPVFTFFATLQWTSFANGVSTATDSLVAHPGLVGRIRFPREVFPIAAVLGRFVDYGFGLIALLVLALLYRQPPGLGLLLVAPLLIIQGVFACGLGMLLGAANVFYRDVRYVLMVLLAMGAYLVPMLYPLEAVPPGYRILYLANPMAALIDTARRVAFPQIGGTVEWRMVAVAAAVAFGTFVTGYVVFKRTEPGFAEAL